MPIIDGMERTRCFDFVCVTCSLKKSLYPARNNDGFFWSVTFRPLEQCWSMSTAQVGFTFPPPTHEVIQRPACVPFLDPSIRVSGRTLPGSRRSCLEPQPAAFFPICRFVKEYIVTLTNHIRTIQDFASTCLIHVDRKEYPQAHICLDDIEARVRAVRRHIEHLQNVRDFCPMPKGGD